MKKTAKVCVRGMQKWRKHWRNRFGRGNLERKEGNRVVQEILERKERIRFFWEKCERKENIVDQPDEKTQT